MNIAILYCIIIEFKTNETPIHSEESVFSYCKTWNNLCILECERKYPIVTYMCVLDGYFRGRFSFEHFCMCVEMTSQSRSTHREHVQQGEGQKGHETTQAFMQVACNTKHSASGWHPESCTQRWRVLHRERIMKPASAPIQGTCPT